MGNIWSPQKRPCNALRGVSRGLSPSFTIWLPSLAAIDFGTTARRSAPTTPECTSLNRTTMAKEWRSDAWPAGMSALGTRRGTAAKLSAVGGIADIEPLGLMPALDPLLTSRTAMQQPMRRTVRTGRLVASPLLQGGRNEAAGLHCAGCCCGGASARSSDAAADESLSHRRCSPLLAGISDD